MAGPRTVLSAFTMTVWVRGTLPNIDPITFFQFARRFGHLGIGLDVLFFDVIDCQGAGFVEAGGPEPFVQTQAFGQGWAGGCWGVHAEQSSGSTCPT